MNEFRMNFFQLSSAVPQQKRPFSFASSTSLFRQNDTTSSQAPIINSPKFTPSPKPIAVQPKPQPVFEEKPVAKITTSGDPIEMIDLELRELSNWTNQQIRFLSNLLNLTNELNSKIDEFENQFR